MDKCECTMNQSKICLCCHESFDSENGSENGSVNGNGVKSGLSTRCYKCHRGVCNGCYDQINKEIREQTNENRKHCKYCHGDFESQCQKCIEQINDKIKYYEKVNPNVLENMFGVRDFADVTTKLYFKTQWVPNGHNFCDCDLRCVCRSDAKNIVKYRNGLGNDFNLYEIADPDGSDYAVIRCEQCVPDPEHGNNFF